MREKLGMDFAWRFHLDNLNRPVPNNMMYYYLHTKAERGRGPAAASFYDGDWEVVDLPHDYAIAGGVDFSASDTAVSLAIHTLVDNQSINIGIDSSFPSRLPELTPCHINLLLLLRKQQILRDRLFFGASLLKQQLHCA